VSEQKHKARTPVQKRGIETKNKIIGAAEALFSEMGYHKTNALEIAARAGVATGSFYGYFNNKKEVLIELIRNFYANALEKVLNAYKAQLNDNKTDNYREGKNLVHFMIQALYDTHEINPALHREFIAMMLLDKEIEDINREEEQKVIESMTSLLNAYRDHIRVKDVEAAAVMLYRVVDEIIHRLRIMGTDIDNERMLAELEDMVCRYLLPGE
jgi:AcrR family transcriptional regulator